MRLVLLETIFYSTISARLKIDYEEWCFPSNVPEDGKFSFNMTTMLPLAKQYLNSANKLGDINLRKDAYKKIINIYSALGTWKRPLSINIISFICFIFDC